MRQAAYATGGGMNTPLFSVARVPWWYADTQRKMPNKLAESRKRHTFALDRKLFDAFKEACRLAGTNMTAEIVRMIEDYTKRTRQGKP